jgi:hypothetical protein
MSDEQKQKEPVAPKPMMPWGQFYSTHSPVMYSEMAERWGGEQQLWEAYASGRMSNAEANYFEGPTIFNAARAFANVVLPLTRKMSKEGGAAFDLYEQLTARIAKLESQVARFTELFGDDDAKADGAAKAPAPAPPPAPATGTTNPAPRSATQTGRPRSEQKS